MTAENRVTGRCASDEPAGGEAAAIEATTDEAAADEAAGGASPDISGRAP
jgi:hypothetical protein